MTGEGQESRWRIHAQRDLGQQTTGNGDGVDLPTNLEIRSEIRRDVTARLLYIVDDVCLIHHIPLSIRYELFQVVRQKFSTYVDSEAQPQQ